MTRSDAAGAAGTPTRFAGAVLAVLAAGCVAHLPTRETLAQGEGAVVLSITSNSEQAPRLRSLLLARPGGGQIATLGVVTMDVSPDTALLIGSVAPDVYEASVLFFNENKHLDLGKEAKAMLGTIRVEAGRVHDLGRLLLTGVNSKLLLGRSPTTTSNVALLGRFAPLQAEIFQGPSAAGWTGPRQEGDRVEEYALRIPTGIQGLLELPDGRVMAPARLGTVMVRDTGGRWAAWRTGELESLAWIAPASRPDGALVAVGELNGIYLFDARGRARRLGPGNLPSGSLAFVHGDDGHGWVVALKAGKTVSLYRSPRLEDGVWTLDATETWPEAWMPWPTFLPFRTASGFGIAAGDGTVRFYDAEGRRRRDARGPPEISSVADIAPSGDRALGLISGRGFTGQLWVTRDEGASWARIEGPGTQKISPPIPLASGRVLLETGFSKRELRATSDDGRTWEVLDGDFYPDSNFAVTAQAGAFAIVSGFRSGGFVDIRRSGDDGKTWSKEYSTFDLQAYEAEKKR